MRYNLDTIATFCLERQDTMETHVKPYWSFVFHRLQVVWYDPKEVLQQTELDRVFINPDGPSDPFPSALALWRWFGSKLKLDELALQKDDIACRHQHSNSLIGCSWARCSLFGEDLTSQLSKPILLCSRCRKVHSSFLFLAWKAYELAGCLCRLNTVACNVKKRLCILNFSMARENY